MNLIFIHHNLIRWTKDELPGGDKQGFCIDNDAAVKQLLAKHAQAAPVVIVFQISDSFKNFHYAIAKVL